MMDLSKRRTSPSNVVAGSVWETRMKMDEGKGGVKVASDEQDMVVGLPLQVNKVLEPIHSGVVREKRKTWKPEPIEVIGGVPVQVRQPGSHHYKLFSESVDASEKSYPIYIDKTRSLFDRLDLDEDFVYDHGEEEEDELGKKGFDVKEVEVPLPFSATVQKLTPEADIEQKCKNFVKDEKKLDKPRTSSPNVVKQAPEFDVLEEKPKKVVKDERRKTWKPEPVEVIGGKPIQIRKHRSDSHKFSKSVDGIEKNPIYMKKSRSLFHRNRRYDVDVNDFDEEEEEEVVEKEIEQLERKSFDVKEVEQSIPISINSNKLIPEIDISELKPKKVEKEEKRLDHVFEEIMPNSAAVLKITPEFSISDEKPKKVLKEEKRLHQVFEKPMPISANGMKLIPEIDLSEQKPKKIVKEEKRPIAVFASVRKQTPETGISEWKAKKAVEDEKKLDQIYEKPIPIPANVKRKLISSRNHLAADHDSFESHPIRYPERFSPMENILQHIVDLVMWSDATKSALVFGLGTFILISSYCIEDLKLSFMSAFCYLGLVCVAAIFSYNSALCRPDCSLYDASEVHLVGEEEAILLLKMILPYFNRFLLKLRAIFYGDLATTMKVAVLLFVLAKYGSSINTSEIVSLGFFGAFIVPKLISSYTPQLMTYSRRFQDFWHSCPHKKYMVLLVFILVWSFSSMVTRIWAVFMLVLAGRYYQQLLMKEEWAPYDEAREDTINSRQGGRRHADRVN